MDSVAVLRLMEVRSQSELFICHRRNGHAIHPGASVSTPSGHIQIKNRKKKEKKTTRINIRFVQYSQWTFALCIIISTVICKVIYRIKVRMCNRSQGMDIAWAEELLIWLLVRDSWVSLSVSTERGER